MLSIVQRHGASRESTTPPLYLRLDLSAVEAALEKVERQWPRIDAELDGRGIGRKDVFSAFLRGNMISAYGLLDDLVSRQVHPFSRDGIEQMLMLNNRVHYGSDRVLMAEFESAIAANVTKFHDNIEPVVAWYEKHARHGDHPLKLAAETYVSILGLSQCSRTVDAAARLRPQPSAQPTSSQSARSMPPRASGYGCRGISRSSASTTSRSPRTRFPR